VRFEKKVPDLIGLWMTESFWDRIIFGTEGGEASLSFILEMILL
jgi:hypothetical protein